jgi:phage replication O-like protein O
MASPQLENGYAQIAHEIMEALAKTNLSPYESRVIWYLLRKTYGYHKKADWISASQFQEGTGLDRRHTWRILRNLSKRNIAVISRDDRGQPIYSFQKDYSKWRVSSPKTTLSSPEGRAVISRGVYKRYLTKDN